MRRKINRVGVNTLTVSLPARWVRQYNLSQGDEIEVSEDKDKIIISGNSDPPKKEISITIGRKDDFLRRLLFIPYVKGFDKITVRYEEPAVYDQILQASKLLMGFEIIENTANSCKLVNVSTKLEENFEVLLNRLFACGITFAQELLSRINSNTGDIKSLLEYESNANRLSLFCRRAIQKGFVTNQAYTANSLYSMVGHLEEAVDYLSQIVESCEHNKTKLNKDTIDLFKDCISIQEINLKAFNRFVSQKRKDTQPDLFKDHKKLRKKVKDNSKYFAGDGVNSSICAKLLGVIETSHHINEELLY